MFVAGLYLDILAFQGTVIAALELPSHGPAMKQQKAWLDLRQQKLKRLPISISLT
jgi:hypothetical protein